MDNHSPAVADTADPAYAHRLLRLEQQRWRRLLNVQAPYRWNIRRLRPGFTLDVGCGLGRNLAHLDGNGVGIDHNAASVAEARARGLRAFTPPEFHASEYAVPARFDSLLLAHLLEHLSADDAAAAVAEHLPYVRDGGQVIVICPQAAGFRSDPTHVTPFDGASIGALLERLDLHVTARRSFPFPAPVGRVFPYNEHVVVARVPTRDP
jgi:SAM-dependent methyltransferase